MASLLVLAGWGVAFVGLSPVFSPGSWQAWARAVACAGLVLAALTRVAWPEARLRPCLVGLIASLGVAVVPTWRQGRLGAWIADPLGALTRIRIILVTGDAPLGVDGVLLDGVLVACVVLVWASTLLVVGLDARVPALLVPSALLLVRPAVVGVRVDMWLVIAVGLLVVGLVWVGAPPRAARWRGGVAALVALVVAALVVPLLPVGRDRVWNTGAVLSPVTGDVPDVTVALGEDLRRGSSTEVFRFTGQMPGTSQRFPLAVLADLDGGGRWKPLDSTDSTLSMQPQRSWLAAGDVSLYPELSVEQVRGDDSTTVETTGLVSSWLPLPLDAVEVTPLADGTQGSKALDASRWSWVSGTQTARSSTSLTSRGTSYRAVGLPYLVEAETARRGYGDAQTSRWPMAFSASSPATVGEGADARTLATSMAPYVELPGALPADVARAAKDATRGAVDRYDAALRLVSWFTSGRFTYDESAPYTPGTNSKDPYSVMEAFLTTRSGYCVHYASTFTVMARSLGMPTRMVVGYAGRASRSWSSVSARNLHAWPEVYFEGLGWVAFEPTPGGAGWRADTGSQDSAPAAALPSPTPTSSGSASPETSPSASAGPSSSSSQSGSNARSGTPSDGSAGAGVSGVGAVSGWVWVLGAVAFVLVVAVCAPGAVRARRRRRRRRRIAGGDEGGAGAAWAELLDTARDLGWLDPGGGASPRARTPEAIVEYLVARGALSERGSRAALEVADAAVAERFGGAGATPEPGATSRGGGNAVAAVGLLASLDEAVADLRRRASARPGARGVLLRARLAPPSVLRREKTGVSRSGP